MSRNDEKKALEPDSSTVSGTDGDPVVERDWYRRHLWSERDDGPPEEPQHDWEQLSGFQRDLLRTICRIETVGEELPTGQGIRRELEPTYSDDINHGRLYQNLGTLYEEGFIRKVPVDGRTNAYYLQSRTMALVDRAARQLADSVGLEASAAATER